jgi:hypothetical protein
VKVIQNYILTLNFVKDKNHKHLKKHIDTQCRAVDVDKKNSKSLHILEDGASSVQVEILNTSLSKICFEYDRI